MPDLTPVERAAEARAARQASTHALLAAVETGREVRDTVTRLRTLNRRNGFTEKIEGAFRA